VTATQSGNNIVYTWSGGGNNGRPVASYSVCIDGQCSNDTAAGTSTITYRCSTGPYTISATVTDSLGQTSGNSKTASASTQTCTPPSPPNLSVVGNGINATWTWSGGGGSPSGITDTWYLCISGSCNPVSASGTLATVYSCGSTVSGYAYVEDSLGQKADSSTATVGIPGCTATVSQGSAGTDQSYCYVSDCAWVVGSVANFAPNTSYAIYLSTNCGGQSAPYYSACIAPPNPGTNNYYSTTITTDANGNWTGNVRLFGFSGANVWFNIGSQYPNGIQSNVITWQ
jgi:hypothetical protein